jgi:apolipoprotein N-acyltransferase
MSSILIKPDRFVGLAEALLAFGAGTLATLAFAPFQWTVLVMVSQALLFGILFRRPQTPARALWLGWLYGVGLFLTGIYWIAICLSVFGVPSIFIALAGMLGLVAVMALYPALFAYLAVKVLDRADFTRLALGIPALWTLTEWLRGWLFSGFPWLALGYTQTDGLLRGLAPIVGVYGLTWCISLSSTAILLLFLGWRARARTGFIVSGLAGAVWLGGGLAVGLSWTTADERALKIALVQGDVAQREKWDPAKRTGTLARYAALTEPLWGETDLVVWPETALPSVSDLIRPYLNALDERGKESQTDILLGILVRETGKTNIYNGLMSFGSSRAAYYKQHLVPFGEYIPLQGILGKPLLALGIKLIPVEDGIKRKPVLRIAGIDVGTSICYEDIFGEEVIQALPEAALLVNASNDAWFGTSTAPYQHLQIARMRALETGRYLLRATNTGISAVIAPDGKVLARSPQFESHVLRATVQAHRGMTPYARLGNSTVVTISSLSLGLVLVGVRRRKTQITGHFQAVEDASGAR